MSLLVGSDGGGSEYWDQNITSSLHVIASQTKGGTIPANEGTVLVT